MSVKTGVMMVLQLITKVHLEFFETFLDASGRQINELIQMKNLEICMIPLK